MKETMRIFLLTIASLTMASGACFLVLGRRTAVAADIEERLPIFDVHCHFHGHSQLPPEDALAMMKDAGIRGALVSSFPAENSLTLHKLAPDVVVPSLMFYKNAIPAGSGLGDRATWQEQREYIDYVNQELERPGGSAYKGIGELHYFPSGAPSYVLQRIADIAEKRGLFLQVHMNKNALHKFLLGRPNLRVLWAHGGWVCGGAMKCPSGAESEMAEPEEVGGMLDEFPNLFVEMSYRDTVGWANLTIEEGPDEGRLPARWRQMMIAHQDRVMVGTDSAVAERWDYLEYIADEMRGWLKEFPKEAARKIAYENAERFFGQTERTHAETAGVMRRIREGFGQRIDFVLKSFRVSSY